MIHRGVMMGLNTNSLNQWVMRGGAGVVMRSCSNKFTEVRSICSSPSWREESKIEVGSSPSFIPTLNAISTPLPRILLRKDLISLDKYEDIRPEVMKYRRSLRKSRRIEIGPHGSLTFENYTMWWVQVHEMLRAENGGDLQITDELNAYGPLVPQNNSIVATLMFEIADRDQRVTFLSQLGNVEDTISLCIGDGSEGDGVSIFAHPAGSDVDNVNRTTPDGKTSAVHFLKFDFTEKETEEFHRGGECCIVVNHPNYPIIAPLQPALFDILKKEL